MTPEMPDHAFAGWLMALETLTGAPDRLVSWQDTRFRFAHRVGELLTSPFETGPVSGAVLYGVYLRGTGLAYVGQTQNAWRRLRDLPVGESHHLANTVPPELWERVVVVEWAKLLGQLRREEQDAAGELGEIVTGLALEHLLQIELRPPLNARRRTGAGMWRDRNLDRSRSRRAQYAEHSPTCTIRFVSCGRAWRLNRLGPSRRGPGSTASATVGLCSHGRCWTSRSNPTGLAEIWPWTDGRV